MTVEVKRNIRQFLFIYLFIYLPYNMKFSRPVNFANFAIQKKIAKLK